VYKCNNLFPDNHNIIITLTYMKVVITPITLVVLVILSTVNNHNNLNNPTSTNNPNNSNHPNPKHLNNPNIITLINLLTLISLIIIRPNVFLLKLTWCSYSCSLKIFEALKPRPGSFDATPMIPVVIKDVTVMISLLCVIRTDCQGPELSLL
jgi:hypothetical protein